MTDNSLVHFDIPIPELIRVLLRIESTHQHITAQLNEANLNNIQSALVGVLDLLQVIDRPDLRSKLSHEINRQLMSLARLEQVPTIDTIKLSQTQRQLGQLQKLLHRSNGKFGRSLREAEFIQSFVQQHHIPGGINATNTPWLYHWLHNTSINHVAEIKNWLQECEDILTLSQQTLYLIRQTAEPMHKTAHQGFYQMSLDPNAPSQLIRISLDQGLKVYPSVSIGRHGLSIRFIQYDHGKKSFKANDDTPFQLACCIF